MQAIIFICLLIGMRLFGEGPILEQDQWYTKFSYQNYSTRHIFDNKGVIRDNYNLFLQNKYRIEADLGLTDKNTLSQQLGFTKVTEQLDGSTEGFTDYQFILKTAFIKQTNQILALETNFNLPLCGDYKPAVRFGNFGAGLMLFYGKRHFINSYPLMTSVGAGFEYFNHIPEDFLKLYARSCFCLNDWLALRATFRLFYGLNNGKHVIDRSLVDFNPNVRLLRAEFEAIVQPINCLEISFGAFINVWGRNVGSGSGFIAAVGTYF